MESDFLTPLVGFIIDPEYHMASPYPPPPKKKRQSVPVVTESTLPAWQRVIYKARRGIINEKKTFFLICNWKKISKKFSIFQNAFNAFSRS